jgi:uncharacterized protein (DUF1499 family)
MKKKIIFGIIVVVVIFAGLLLIARTFYPTNIAETAPAHAEEILRTRHYQIDLKTFIAETEKIIPALSTYGRSWRLDATDAGQDSAFIRAEVPVVFFTDDLEIRAEKDASAGGIVVNIRSNSRVGKSDFGENRRHVLQILAALDARFKN